MPTPDQLKEEWLRYYNYYSQQRLEAGVPSVFEIWWGAHLAAHAQVMGEPADASRTDWIKDPSLARHFSPEILYKRIVDEIASCHSCELAKHRTMTVPGTGPLRTDLAVVGEAPGKDEDACGHPFVGAAGQELFDKMFPAWAKRERSSIFIANTTKCRPPNNRDPKPEELAACRHFLYRQLMIVNPKVIIAAGKHAARWLTGQPVKTVKEVHGKTFWFGHIPVLTMPHPAAYLHSGKKQWGQEIYDTMMWAKWIADQPFDSDYWSK